ncbi:DUF2786 domain-containing protein [Vibrio parahaemolyticus]
MSKDNKKIIDKVRKLLALAESSNPNEALLAAKRARRLMDDHSITKEEIENADNDQFLETVSDHIKKVRDAWITDLKIAVAKLNDCEAVTEQGRGYVAHKFRGFTADAIVAKMTLDYLIDTCERCCKGSGIKGRSEKNQFRLGFADSIYRKVEGIMRERKAHFVATTGTDLVPLKMNQIKAHFGELDTAKAHKTRKPTGSEIEAYINGAIAGDKTSLDKQVDGEETTKIKLCADGN